MRHPPLECLGFRLAGTEDEGIEAGFCYDPKRPSSSSCFRDCSPHRHMSGLHHDIKANISFNDVGIDGCFFIFIQAGKSLSDVVQIKCRAHVLRHKPRFAVVFDNTNLTEFLVLENLNLLRFHIKTPMRSSPFQNPQ